MTHIFQTLDLALSEAIQQGLSPTNAQCEHEESNLQFIEGYTKGICKIL